MSHLLNRLTMRMRIILGSAALFVVTLILAVIAIFALNEVIDRTDKADDANRIVKYVLELRGEEQDYLSSGKASDAEKVLNLIETISGQIEETSQQFENAQNEALLTSLSRDLTAYQKNFGRYLQLDQQAAEQQLLMEQAARVSDEVLEDFREQQKQQVRVLLNNGAAAADVLEELREADAANRLIKYLLEARRYEKDVQLKPESSAVKQVRDELEAALILVADMAAQAERESSKQIASEVRQEFSDYRDAFLQFVEAQAEQKDLHELLLQQVRELENEAENLRADQKKELLATTDRANLIIFGFLLISAILAAFISWMLVRAVIAPLREATLAMQDIAEGEGDLTRRLPVKGNHEIADLGRAFNAFAERMRRSIATVASSAANLSAASEELSATAEQSSSAITEQRQQTDSLATAMNEMSATTQDVSANISSTSEAADQAKAQADSGAQVVSRTVEQIHGVAAKIEQAGITIDELAQRAEGVTAVLDVISGIADQTNLLALNAAIEAARAGQEGRGFAVVADEVRTLAGRTQTSAQEIATIIEQLQASARQSVEVMNLCRKDTEQATKLGNESGRALSSITSSVATILELSTQIASAAEQQSMTSEEMNANTQSIHDMSSQNATAIEQTSETTRELARMASELQSMVETFKV
ncbi:methyl-accepting chemotaxis protein [Idiomarina seosinensis]|uniref:methyl-accepting chemotaxis protein n=1 Tax=Idiomarina seosinensis TaxID=281739 RepID=UPI00384C4B53